jgi:hypothetical protein
MTEDISNSFTLNRVGFWEHRFCQVCDGVFAIKHENEMLNTEEETAETRNKNHLIAKMAMKERCVCDRGFRW